MRIDRPWLRARWLPMALAACSASVLASCGATCDRNPDEPPVRHTTGRTNVAAGFYESSPPEGPFLDFPGGRTIEFVHELGRAPDDVRIWLSFDRCPMPEPCEPGDDVASNVTMGVGNQALIEDISAEHVVIRNDTCSEIQVRLTANIFGAPGFIAPADAGVP